MTAEAYIRSVQERHRTATDLARRSGQDYRRCYALLREAERYPYRVDLQVALQRAMQREPAERPRPAQRAAAPVARQARVRAAAGDLRALMAGALAEPYGSPRRMRAEAVRDELVRREGDAWRQRGVADAIVAVR